MPSITIEKYTEAVKKHYEEFQQDLASQNEAQFRIKPSLTTPIKGFTQEKLPTELLSKIETNIKKAEDIIQQRGKTLEKPYYEDVNNVPKLAEKISAGAR